MWCTDNFTKLSQAICFPADQLIMMSLVVICSIVYRVYRSMEGSRCPCALGCRNDVERCLAQSGCAVKHSTRLPDELMSSREWVFAGARPTNFLAHALDWSVPGLLQQLHGAGRLPQGTQANRAAMHSHCRPPTALCSHPSQLLQQPTS